MIGPGQRSLGEKAHAGAVAQPSTVAPNPCSVLQAHHRENWAWRRSSFQIPPRSVSALVSSYDPGMYGSRPLSSALSKDDG